jgi:hypothetical protein
MVFDLYILLPFILLIPLIQLLLIARFFFLLNRIQHLLWTGLALINDIVNLDSPRLASTSMTPLTCRLSMNIPIPSTIQTTITLVLLFIQLDGIRLFLTPLTEFYPSLQSNPIDMLM